ncbi:MAG: transposase [Verrucomicrobiota bacterium]
MQFGRNNLKATLGVTAVLHTWSQNVLDHYHLHCVVTGGGLSLEGQSWVSLSPKWLFPVRALSIVFRAKFRDGLKQLFDKGELQFPNSQPGLSHPVVFARLLRRVCRHKWVVYTKRPFAGPQAVLAYLCRYTHRVAITNNRLEVLDLQNGTVTFRYKDYAHDSQIRSMTLPLEEFLRRFCLHILPPRFVKIRGYGLHSNRNRSTRIAQARAVLAQSPALPEQQATEEVLTIKHLEPPPLVCPNCGQQSLVLIGVIARPKKPPIWDTS